MLAQELPHTRAGLAPDGQMSATTAGAALGPYAHAARCACFVGCRGGGGAQRSTVAQAGVTSLHAAGGAPWPCPPAPPRPCPPLLRRRYDAAFGIIVLAAQANHVSKVLRGARECPAAHAWEPGKGPATMAPSASSNGNGTATVPGADLPTCRGGLYRVNLVLPVFWVALAVVQLLLVFLHPARYSRIRMAWILTGRLLRATSQAWMVPRLASEPGLWRTLMAGVHSSAPVAAAWQVLFAYGGPLNCLLQVLTTLLPTRWCAWIHILPFLPLVHWHSHTIALELQHPDVFPGYVPLCSVPLSLSLLFLGPGPIPEPQVDAFCRQHVRGVVVVAQVLLGYVLPVTLSASIELAMKRSVVVLAVAPQAPQRRGPLQLPATHVDGLAAAHDMRVDPGEGLGSAGEPPAGDAAGAAAAADEGVEGGDGGHADSRWSVTLGV